MQRHSGNDAKTTEADTNADANGDRYSQTPNADGTT